MKKALFPAFISECSDDLRIELNSHPTTGTGPFDSLNRTTFGNPALQQEWVFGVLN